MIKRALLLLLVMTAILAGMIVERMLILNRGAIITLETEPVDPRSLFRGDYMRIRYVIGELDSHLLQGDNDFVPGEAVYLVVTQGANWWVPVSMHRTMPNTDGRKQVIIKGVVRSDNDSLDGDNNIYGVGYGIETYFVPEGEGLELEQQAGTGELTFKIAVSQSGVAAIHSLYRDDVQLYEEGFF